jgi:glycosyltransferase involved in cell wall biosynthesis
MSINIVLPVLNEERALEYGVTTTIGYLESSELNNNYLITIADNGSTDRTQEIALELCKQYSQVNYFRVSRKGVGLAFREAIKNNTCDFIGYMDVDLATNLRHLNQVYSVLSNGETSIVVGSRLAVGAKVVGRTLKREITSRGLNFLLHLILKVKFTDAMCGFKFYEKKIAEHLVEECGQTDGWFFCAEMMIQAEWDGICVHEIPVEWHDDPDSKVKVTKLSVNYMSEIIALFKQKKIRRKRI